MPGRKRKVLTLGEAPLARDLLDEWVGGERAATRVQKLAESATKGPGGNKTDTIKHLASIGHNGKNQSVCERDLLRLKLSKRDGVDMPPLYEAKISVKKKKNGQIKQQKHAPSPMKHKKNVSQARKVADL